MIRYKQENVRMEEHPKGCWVKWEDHKAIISMMVDIHELRMKKLRDKAICPLASHILHRKNALQKGENDV